MYFFCPASFDFRRNVRQDNQGLEHNIHHDVCHQWVLWVFHISLKSSKAKSNAVPDGSKVCIQALRRREQEIGTSNDIFHR